MDQGYTSSEHEDVTDSENEDIEYSEDEDVADPELINPWLSLHYHHKQLKQADEETTAGGQPFPLGKLPHDLIYYIAKNCMAPQTATAFALVNKALYGILGPRFFALNNTQKWELMLLLERDRTLLIACPWCVRLHHPLAQSPRNRQTRKCHEDWIEQPAVIPSTITNNMVRLFGKLYLMGESYTEVLGWMSRSISRVFSTYKAHYTISCRVTSGNLFVKTQTVLSPIHDGEATVCALYHLDHDLAAMPCNSQRICNHKEWGKSMDVDTRALSETADCIMDTNQAHAWHNHVHECFPSTFVVDLSRLRGNHTISTKLFCALKHQQPCETCHLIFPNYGEADFGLVKSRNLCCTDYSVTVVDDLQLGRLIIATTWKDLGGFLGNNPIKWETHLEDQAYAQPGFEDRMTTAEKLSKEVKRDIEPTGTIYRTFEGPASSGEPMRYAPTVGPQILGDFLDEEVECEGGPSGKWFHPLDFRGA